MKATTTLKKMPVPTSSKNDIIFNLKNCFLLLLFLLLSIVNTAFGQNSCKATLIVQDNGYVDSASAEGVVYKMILTNNGFETDSYILSSVNINSNCKNPDDSSIAKNVLLSTIFLDSNQNQITEITVAAGESISFTAKLTIPLGTMLERWSCNQIIAASTTCTYFKVNSILHTYVLNPNND
ncbi:hypothetical protein [Flavobacterium sp. TSSA_36]|uniref:hypothetical protein n=1 Tax=Flavobacterium sp. TSSA_36 TaxID=3447669 RepID=UPI003F371D06